MVETEGFPGLVRKATPDEKEEVKIVKAQRKEALAKVDAAKDDDKQALLQKAKRIKTRSDLSCFDDEIFVIMDSHTKNLNKLLQKAQQYENLFLTFLEQIEGEIRFKIVSILKDEGNLVKSKDFFC